jgi:hypothetical protein
MCGRNCIRHLQMTSYVLPIMPVRGKIEREPHKNIEALEVVLSPAEIQYLEASRVPELAKYCM